MICQEVEIEEFESNRAKSSGRGPSEAERMASDRAAQIKHAQEFAETLKSQDEVLEEAEEVMEPSTFTAGPKARHRPPKKSEQYSEQGVKTPSKQDKKRRRKNITRPSTIPGKIAQLETIVGQPCDDILPRRRKGRHVNPSNPPIIVFPGTLAISRCTGCNKNITPGQKKFPNNMLFRRRGVKGFLNPKTKQWVDSEHNCYFHLNLNCLRKHDPEVELCQITCNHEVFLGLTAEQADVLNAKGFLAYLVAHQKRALEQVNISHK